MRTVHKNPRKSKKLENIFPTQFNVVGIHIMWGLILNNINYIVINITNSWL